jgi:broad specificity phosphatase PhoE
METTTTFIVVRHAERESAETDAHLNRDGLLRADALRHTLSSVAIAAIYATPYNRTRQTVKLLADEKGISITGYSTRNSYEDLIDDILAVHLGKVVVIVGHSFTIPDLVKTLTKNSFVPAVAEDEYDNLFIVHYSDRHIPGILQLKYGRNTP